MTQDSREYVTEHTAKYSSITALFFSFTLLLCVTFFLINKIFGNIWHFRLWFFPLFSPGWLTVTVKTCKSELFYNKTSPYWIHSQLLFTVLHSVNNKYNKKNKKMVDFFRFFLFNKNSCQSWTNVYIIFPLNAFHFSFFLFSKHKVQLPILTWVFNNKLMYDNKYFNVGLCDNA